MRIGVIGGGQLGRMLGLAGIPLGMRCRFLDPAMDCPAAIAGELVVGAYDDPGSLATLIDDVDLVTYEFENVPALAVEKLTGLGVLVAPGARALAVAQDRVEEKTFLNGAGAPTVAFIAADDGESAREAVAALGAPALMKTRREGYDGKGQVWIRDAADAEAAFDAIGRRPAILEAAVFFNRELSVIAARSHDGAVAVYPLGENIHANGVLKTTLAPAAVDAKTQARAVEIASAVLDGLDYVGVMGIELFDMGDGVLLVNEVAPRVHNTGHWTQDGCVCDQFEQHVRAIVGWPLGPTEAHARIEMTNLLGDEIDQWRALAAEPNARLHLYGKHEARAGRKMAHVNRIL